MILSRNPDLREKAGIADFVRQSADMPPLPYHEATCQLSCPAMKKV